jgi:hypothetical protein
LHHMQTHNSQRFQRVLQNPLVTLPIFMCLLRAAHSRFNQVKSLLGSEKVYSLYHSFTWFAPRCPRPERPGPRQLHYLECNLPPPGDGAAPRAHEMRLDSAFQVETVRCQCHSPSHESGRAAASPSHFLTITVCG